MSGDFHEMEQMASTKPKELDDVGVKLLPPYNVILNNDDYHSVDFVIQVLQKALGYNQEKSYQLTMEAHNSGRSVIWTGQKEVAEFKVEQIQTYHEIREPGNVKLGPVDCFIEPAPGA